MEIKLNEDLFLTRSKFQFQLISDTFFIIAYRFFENSFRTFFISSDVFSQPISACTRNASVGSHLYYRSYPLSSRTIDYRTIVYSLCLTSPASDCSLPSSCPASDLNVTLTSPSDNSSCLELFSFLISLIF